jgi:transcription initiation factor TFIIIB Brf1 subunit/transcription initiation factor TFIIB
MSGRGMGRHSDGRDSREATLQNAKKAISQVATSLSLPLYYVERSFRLYQLALQRNFIFGRKQTHVVSTCLYIICRQEKSPHLLIDFSDALQINVFVLGKSFLQFSRILNLNLPVVDPSLYIHRYAISLKLGDKMNSVVTTSLRIVTRLKKDWIATGRRPDGVCAVAMLIACRSHNFEISHNEISELFRISNETLKNRLNDFKSTPSAQLTLEQFHNNDMDVEYDPPSFIRNKIKEAKLNKTGIFMNLPSKDIKINNNDIINNSSNNNNNYNNGIVAPHDEGLVYDDNYENIINKPSFIDYSDDNNNDDNNNINNNIENNNNNNNNNFNSNDLENDDIFKSTNIIVDINKKNKKSNLKNINNTNNNEILSFFPLVENPLEKNKNNKNNDAYSEHDSTSDSENDNNFNINNNNNNKIKNLQNLTFNERAIEFNKKKNLLLNNNNNNIEINDENNNEINNNKNSKKNVKKRKKIDDNDIKNQNNNINKFEKTFIGEIDIHVPMPGLNNTLMFLFFLLFIVIFYIIFLLNIFCIKIFFIYFKILFFLLFIFFFYI